MQKVKTAPPESRDLQVARRIAEKRELRRDINEMLLEGIPTEAKIDGIVIEALKELSLVKSVLNRDISKLDGYELDGVTRIINNVDNMLRAAAELYGSTH